MQKMFRKIQTEFAGKIQIATLIFFSSLFLFFPSILLASELIDVQYIPEQLINSGESFITYIAPNRFNISKIQLFNNCLPTKLSICWDSSCTKLIYSTQTISTNTIDILDPFGKPIRLRSIFNPHPSSVYVLADDELVFFVKIDFASNSNCVYVDNQFNENSRQFINGQWINQYPMAMNVYYDNNETLTSLDISYDEQLFFKFMYFVDLFFLNIYPSILIFLFVLILIRFVKRFLN